MLHSLFPKTTCLSLFFLALGCIFPTSSGAQSQNPSPASSFFSTFIHPHLQQEELLSLYKCKDSFGFSLQQSIEFSTQSLKKSITTKTSMKRRSQLIYQEWSVMIDRWNYYLLDPQQLHNCRYPIHALVRAAPFVQYFIEPHLLSSTDLNTKQNHPLKDIRPICSAPNKQQLLELTQRKELSPQILPPMNEFIYFIAHQLCQNVSM